MNAQIACALILLLLMVAILSRAAWMKFETGDTPCTYKLFAVRDKLIRLVIDKRIARDDPYFDAMYQNVTIMLRSSRLISGPSGWPLAAWSGKMFAHKPEAGARLRALPTGRFPDELVPIAEELSHAMRHVAENHFGIFLQWDASRREALKIRKEQAKEFLKLLNTTPGPRASAY
jgi:hypothetical protein